MVRYRDGITEELAAPVAILRRDYDEVEPVSDAVFEVFTRLYTYSRSELNATIDSRDESAPDWIREEINVDTADGEGRVPILLFLPKGVDPPYQVVVLFPGLGAFSNRRSHDDLCSLASEITSSRAAELSCGPSTRGRMVAGTAS